MTLKCSDGLDRAFVKYGNSPAHAIKKAKASLPPDVLVVGEAATELDENDIPKQ